MSEEKIINKIKNLLDLSNNNPNENEAIAAALKAQELMAKYDISMTQLDNSNESKEIVEMIYKNTGKHEMKNWKYGLANVVARNFKCKHFMYGKDIVFYGFKDDAEIALQVFTYLYEVGNKLAVKYYNKCKSENKNTKGIMNTYLLGFRQGVASVLEKQCVALMIIVPKEVSDQYDIRTANAKSLTYKMHTTNDNAAMSAGLRDGKDAMNAKSIEG